MGKVNALLTDDTVTELKVETDDHKCAFVAFIYGENRKNAEAMVPALAPLFKSIEEPYQKLHKTTVDIQNHFKQADHQLPETIADKIADHLKWAGAVQNAMKDERSTLGVETDPSQCALGKWIETDGAKEAYNNSNDDFSDF